MSRNINQQRQGASAFELELDLSAFEPERQAQFAQDDIRPPSVQRAMATPILRSQKSSERETTKRRSILAPLPKAKALKTILPIGRKNNVAPVQQSLSARPDHLQAPPSDKRKERSRVNCKQRPEPKKSGSGSSRKFVPWCERKK